MPFRFSKAPGLRAPALILAAAAALHAPPALAQAQPAPPIGPLTAAPPPISAQPVPGELELAKLVWSAMVAVDQANNSGNYSVLRDNAASGFQIANDPAKLAQIFANLRASRIDLASTLLVAPGYAAAPERIRPDAFRIRGFFALRPTAITFDLIFQWERGGWRLFGISIDPRPMALNPPRTPAPATRRN